MSDSFVHWFFHVRCIRNSARQPGSRQKPATASIENGKRDLWCGNFALHHHGTQFLNYDHIHGWLSALSGSSALNGRLPVRISEVANPSHSNRSLVSSKCGCHRSITLILFYWYRWWFMSEQTARAVELTRDTPPPPIKVINGDSSENLLFLNASPSHKLGLALFGQCVLTSVSFFFSSFSFCNLKKKIG